LDRLLVADSHRLNGGPAPLSTV